MRPRAEVKINSPLRYTPPLPTERCLAALMLRISDRQLRVQSHTRLHSGSANETFSSRFRHRMPMFPPFITYASSDMLVQLFGKI
jgi:hypothetical protein